MAAKTGTYTLIASTTIGSTGSSLTFSSIPQTYTDLVIVSNALRGISGSGGDLVRLQFNGDTSSNYSWTQGYGNGSSAVSNNSTNQTQAFAGAAADATGTSNWCPNICHILDYANTTTYKSALARVNQNGSYTGIVINLWRSTAAINSIYLTATNGFTAGSTFKLYGIEAGNV
jgi:hypothetical protein